MALTSPRLMRLGTLCISGSLGPIRSCSLQIQGLALQLAFNKDGSRIALAQGLFSGVTTPSIIDTATGKPIIRMECQKYLHVAKCPQK
jgi:hypothetical protein